MAKGTPTENFHQQPLFARYRPAVDSYIKTFIEQEAGDGMDMLLYHMGYSDREGKAISDKFDGKGIRPTLALLTADALGVNWQQFVPAAASLELFHNFTLIHDDIQDGDIHRHGKPTVWTSWNTGQGINAGDCMAYISSLALLQLSQNGFSPEKVLKVAQRLTRTGVNVINGQIRDLSFEGRMDVTLDEYYKMISRKTGALLNTSIMVAVDMADIGEATSEGLDTLGLHLGRAFQISDDILGIWGAEGNTGKRQYGDIVHKKKSLPVILAINSKDAIGAQRLQEIYSQDTGELSNADLEEVLAIFDKMDIKEKVEELLTSAYNSAVEAIGVIDLQWAKDDFIMAADALSHRRK